jgi:hypothetical protein
VRGTGAAADGAAAAMEELDVHTGLGAHLGESGLAPLEGPLAGEDSGVLVRVRVPDHDLLARATGAAGATGVELQAGAGDGEFEEGAEQFRASLQVLDGFEQRDDGQQADHPFREHAQEAGFAGEDVDRQQVGHAPCHAHDQGTEAVGSVRFEVRREDAVGREDGVGFGSGRGGRMEERARGTDLAFEEAEPFGLGPLFPLRGIDARGGEQLSDGAVVEGGVLADVEDGEVESEGAEDAPDRVDVVMGEPCGSGFAEGAVKGLEVFVEFRGTAVTAGGVADLGKLAGCDGHRKAGGEEFRSLTPGFAGMHLQDRARLIAEGGDRAVPEFDEAGRRGLDPFRERQAFGEGDQLPVEDDEGVGPETFQGFGGDFRGDARMTVAIAADPRAESESGAGGVRGQGGRIESGAGPGDVQAAVEFGDDTGAGRRGGS